MRTFWLPILALAAAKSCGAADALSPRPQITCSPNPCPGEHRTFPPREKLCYVKSTGDGQDDSQHILNAVHECNNGGRVVFREGVNYTIGTALDLTFMKNIDLGNPFQSNYIGT
jgi:galacturan 1,4-alpha-galacturonidase